MKLIVINLKQAECRRAHMRSAIKAQSLKFDWFEAINGNNLEQETTLNQQDYRFSENLLPGEIGCFLSHIACWENILAKGLNQAVIFEDDVVLGQHATRFLSKSDWLPKEFDLIKIDTHLSPCHLDSNNPMELDDNRKLCELLDKHYCTGGYVISARGARRLLSSVKMGVINFPVDDYIYSSQKTNPQRAALQTYQMVPALCIQIGTLKKDPSIFPSYIQRQRKFAKQHKTLPQKIRRETWRIILKSFKLLSDRLHHNDKVIIPFR